MSEKPRNYRTQADDFTDDDILDVSIKQIVEAIGGIAEIEVPTGFRSEIMRAVRVENSLEGAPKKAISFYGLTKIIKKHYIFAIASAACMFLAFLSISSLLKPGGGAYETATQEYNTVAEAPAAPAPAAVAPDMMAVSGGSTDYGVGSGIFNGQIVADRDMDAAYEAELEEAGEAIIEAAGVVPAQSASADAEGRVTEKIIRTAYYSIEVTDFEMAVSDIQAIANFSGGYIENFNSSIYNTFFAPNGGRDLRSGGICLRVPQSAYAEAKISLDELGKITGISESVDNITSGYIDTAARLDVKRAEEQRLLELFSKAEKIDDLISLESRLTYVRSDIEAMMAQLQSWDRSVSFSTINISLTEVVDYSTIQQLDPTLGQKITEGFNRSVANFTYNIERLVISVAENSIAILVFIATALIILAVVSIYKRCRRRD